MSADNEPELLPCPFCGSNRVELLPYWNHRWTVVCHECHVGTGHSPSKQVVIEHWNHRTDIVEQLQKKLDSLEKSILDLSHPNMRMLLSERNELLAKTQRLEKEIEKLTLIISLGSEY